MFCAERLVTNLMLASIPVPKSMICYAVAQQKVDQPAARHQPEDQWAKLLRNKMDPGRNTGSFV